MRDKISPERKTAYYVGTAIAAFGMLMFLSVFVTHAFNFGNFENFDGQVRSSMFRSIGGMVLMMIGMGMRAVGARGLAGSGVILDPARARKELKPFSKMVGGMVGDALDESGIPKKFSERGERVVMIRCKACEKLNEEDSKFCQECGVAI